MFVKRSTYNNVVDELNETRAVLYALRTVDIHTEQHLRSAESALVYKEDVIEELQAEVYELTQERDKERRSSELWQRDYERLRCEDGAKWKGLYYETESELNQSRIIKQRQVEEAEVARRKAEAELDALKAAQKISYVVALHINDVPARPRLQSLDVAYDTYMESTRPNVDDVANGIQIHYPYRIYALRGDEVIADVTDPATWNETLPISERRDETLPVSEKRDQEWGDLVATMRHDRDLWRSAHP